MSDSVDQIKAEMAGEEREIKDLEREKHDKEGDLAKTKQAEDKLEGEIHALESKINHDKSDLDRKKQDLGRIARGINK